MFVYMLEISVRTKRGNHCAEKGNNISVFSGGCRRGRG